MHSKSLQHSEKLHSSALARTTSLEHKLLEWNKTSLAEQEISKTHWKSTLVTACTNQVWCIGKTPDQYWKGGVTPFMIPEQ